MQQITSTIALSMIELNLESRPTAILNIKFNTQTLIQGTKKKGMGGWVSEVDQFSTPNEAIAISPPEGC